LGSPLVTVVIPCYNQARYLRDALRSVVDQRYTPLEVIVVDDGSTDDSAEVALRSGITPIRQPNAGLGVARNVGLAAAHGEFVVFLDADDELLPNAVASGVATLTASPKLSCVVRRCQLMDAEGRALPANYPPVTPTELYRQWLRTNFAWTPGAVMFRRSRIAEIGGFPADIGPAADYAVYLTLARNEAVAYEPREVVRYRQHGSNMSHDPVVMLTATLRVLREERPHLPKGAWRDYRAGLRAWREFYGEQIVERLRREWRMGIRGSWQQGAVVALARECPRVLATHVSRKATRLLRRLPPAVIEPGAFHR
jgi:glycosyltransferase involved in cell wall biosynthesis